MRTENPNLNENKMQQTYFYNLNVCTLLFFNQRFNELLKFHGENTKSIVRILTNTMA